MEYCIIDKDGVATSIVGTEKVTVTVTELFGDKEVTYEKIKSVNDLTSMEKEEANVYVVIQQTIGKYQYLGDITYKKVNNKIVDVKREILSDDINLEYELSKLKTEAVTLTKRKHSELNIIDLQVWRGDSEFTVEDMKEQHQVITDEYHGKLEIINSITTLDEFIEKIVNNGI